MDRDYDEECIRALDDMYKKYGINMNDAETLDMINALEKELNVKCGGHVMSANGASMSEDEFDDLMLHTLEEHYLDEIGKRNIFLI